MLILNPDAEGLAQAASFLADSRPVAFPTETVYGLGAIAFDARGVAAIFAAKSRPPDNPLIVHVGDIEQVSAVASKFSDAARALAERFWPGPLTLVLRRGAQVPEIVSAGLFTVAVRQPSHPVALALIRAVGFPIAAPSANRSGRPSPTCVQHVCVDLEGRIPAVLDGGSCAVGVESTVLDMSGATPRILRPGGISPEQLADVLGFVPPVADAEHAAASPGTRHHHYRPCCEVVIYEGDPPRAEGASGIVRLGPHVPEEKNTGETWRFERRLASNEDYARSLFAILREADDAGARKLYLPWPMEDGIGLALRDRIARAAGMKKGAD